MPKKKINAKVLRNLVTAVVNGSITLAIPANCSFGIGSRDYQYRSCHDCQLFSGSLAEIVMDFLSSPEIDVEILPERGRSKPGNAIDHRRGAEDLRRHDE